MITTDVITAISDLFIYTIGVLTMVKTAIGIIAIIGLTALILNAKDNAQSKFCDTVGSKTMFSEGMDIAEYNTDTEQWNGIPNEAFEGKPYLNLVGPDDGTYTVFYYEPIGLIIAPFVNMEIGVDGYPHNTCGYLITWTIPPR